MKTGNFSRAQLIAFTQTTLGHFVFLFFCLFRFYLPTFSRLLFLSHVETPQAENGNDSSNRKKPKSDTYIAHTSTPIDYSSQVRYCKNLDWRG